MSAAALAEPREAVPDAGDDTLCHYYCCNPDKALCGSDLTGLGDAEPDDEVDCVVCLDIEAADAWSHGTCAAADCPGAA